MYSSLIHKHSGYLYNKERGIGEWECGPETGIFKRGKNGESLRGGSVPSFFSAT